jgi:CHAT domain-containing protein/tetratricopeptide (TPR) repeat protein
LASDQRTSEILAKRPSAASPSAFAAPALPTRAESNPRRLAAVILLFGVLALWPSAAASQKLPETTDPNVAPEVAERLDAGLAEADRLRAAWRLDEALPRYEAIVADATAANAKRHLAAALSGRGRVQGFQSHREAAKASHEQALAIYKELNDLPGEALASRYLGMNLLQLAQYDAARKMLDRAIELYRDLDDAQGLASAYNNLVYLLAANRTPEKEAIRELAFRYAREAGDKSAECSVTHEWGDELFQEGDFIQAKEKLTTALACFESIGELSDAGRVLTSLGRLQRVHGQLAAAMDHYQRALEMQKRYEAQGQYGSRGPDPLGIIQSYNAIAVTYGYMGHHVEALAHYEKALAGARALKSELTINFLIGQLGGYYLGLAEYEKAITLLEPTLTQPQREGILQIRVRQLAWAYLYLGNLDRARELAERGVADARKRGTQEVLGSLVVRAAVLRKQKAYDAAERDLLEGIDIIEDMRAKTIPIDLMKRGFTEEHQRMFAERIELLGERGRWQPALQTAEQARARAFLDLLATRNDAQARNTQPSTVIARGQIARLQPPPISGALAPLASQAARAARAAFGPQLTSELSTSWRPGASWGPAADSSWRFRGGALAADGVGWPEYAPQVQAPQIEGANIESSRSVQPATIAEMIATAKRLQSTLLTYWVAPNGTFAWVISPRGQVNATRIDVPSMKLDTLVAQAAEAVNGSAAFGGLGIGLTSQTRPFRELYGLLIRPIRQYLPAGNDGLLTIVPHGPLFRVSFAALQDEKGQYLIERYRVHYTPAVGVLQFTARADAAAPKQALLIGDPGALKSDSGEAMPALPWARKEVAEIAATLPEGAPHVLVDAEASEASVRAKLEGMDLIHFATHGVIQQQRSLTSYLALRGGNDNAVRFGGSAPSTIDALNDGRLTAEEVYNLRLQAKLVVLSACSTALGPATGDGVIGFTRAFLYAGASSVIATEWDVPDEAGYELMRRFYRHRTAAPGAESLALRAAQVGVIQALRKGTIKVTTLSGDVALPEHPLFWAGFVLVGEP